MKRTFSSAANGLFRSSQRGNDGFVLFETMLAVAIFATGMIALGWCLENCLRADLWKEEDARARRALENELALIESGAKPMADATTEDLKGMFTGMKLKTTRKPLKEKNEKDQEIFGIFLVNLQVSWLSGGEPQTRELAFYVYPRQR